MVRLDHIFHRIDQRIQMFHLAGPILQERCLCRGMVSRLELWESGFLRESLLSSTEAKDHSGCRRVALLVTKPSVRVPRL